MKTFRAIPAQSYLPEKANAENCSEENYYKEIFLSWTYQFLFDDIYYTH